MANGEGSKSVDLFEVFESKLVKVHDRVVLNSRHYAGICWGQPPTVGICVVDNRSRVTVHNQRTDPGWPWHLFGRSLVNHSRWLQDEKLGLFSSSWDFFITSFWIDELEQEERASAGTGKSCSVCICENKRWIDRPVFSGFFSRNFLEPSHTLRIVTPTSTS